MSDQTTETGYEKEDLDEPTDPLRIEFSEVNTLSPAGDGTINNPDEQGSSKRGVKREEIIIQDFDDETKDNDMEDVDLEGKTQYPLKSGFNEADGITGAVDGSGVYSSTVYDGSTEITPEDIGLVTTGPIIKRDYGGSRMKDMVLNCGNSSLLGCGICCCCYWLCVLCCLCIFLVALIVVGTLMLVTYLKCVSSIITKEEVIQLNMGTTYITFDHYGSFSAKSSNISTGGSFYMVIRSRGKKKNLPNYDVSYEASSHITKITQKHLYDGSMTNEAFGIVCEGFDVELIIPASMNVAMETKSRLYGNMSIDDIANFRSLKLDVSHGDVNFRELRISGDFQLKSKFNQKISMKELNVLGSSSMDIEYGSATIEDHYVGNDLNVRQKYGTMSLDHVTVAGTTAEIYKRYDDFSAKLFNGVKAKLSMDFDESNLAMETYQFSSIDITKLDYCYATFESGNVQNDFTIVSKYVDQLTIDYLNSNWGKLTTTSKYGNVLLKNLETMDVESTSKYGNVKMELMNTYYGYEKVFFDFSVKDDGDVKINDGYGHVQLTEDDRDLKKGYINPTGGDMGRNIKVENRYGDITLEFTS